MIIDTKENQYIITKADKPPKTVKSVKFQNGVTILRNNFDNKLEFTASGSPNKGGTIHLTNRKKESIRITITPATGKINYYIDK